MFMSKKKLICEETKYLILEFYIINGEIILLKSSYGGH
jgi:hypothetical protein